MQIIQISINKFHYPCANERCDAKKINNIKHDYTERLNVKASKNHTEGKQLKYKTWHLLHYTSFHSFIFFKQSEFFIQGQEEQGKEERKKEEKN